MSGLIGIALRSLRNRAFTATLTVCTVALSVALLVGVERLRLDTREAFVRSVSGTDLIVGARSHPVQLLLYSVFRLGDPTNNLGWDSAQRLRADPRVAWVIPIALGDSHQGFRVVGTEPDYFNRIRYAGDRALEFQSGRAFAGGAGDQLFEAVIGADVASKLGYALGQSIVVAHGTARVALQKHDDRPFTVVGIMARSGTPSDQGVFVSPLLLLLACVIAANGCGGGSAPSATTVGATSPVDEPMQVFIPPPGSAASAAAHRSDEINWLDLMPDAERRALEAGEWADVDIDHNSVGANEQLGSSQAVPSMDARTVRIPGYVVPLEMDDQQRMRSFFLVPYYGACIHVPPPPPNQMIYAELEVPIEVPSMWDAYWLTGRLKIDRFDGEIASSSYRALSARLEPWAE